MTNSEPVAAGDIATADQYNHLRADVVDTANGHHHDGVDSRAVAVSLSEVEATLAANAAAAAGNTWYDALSITLGVGTWLVLATAVASVMHLRVRDTTTNTTLSIGSGSPYMGTSVDTNGLAPAKVVVASGTKVVKLQYAAPGAGATVYAISPSAPSDATPVATRIVAFRIA
jgi:hypothetical protein